LCDLETDFHLDPNQLLPSSDGEIMNRLILRHDLLPYESMEAVTNACSSLPEIMALDNILYAKYVWFDYAYAMDPVGQVDPWFITPVYSDIPTLVMNGDYDCNTGVDWAAEVASHLPNSHLVIVPTVGHGVLLGGHYPAQTMRNFLANPWQDPTPAGLSEMRVAFTPLWPTNTPLLVSGQSVATQFDQSGQGAWYRFQAAQNVLYDIQFSLPDAQLRILDATGKTVAQFNQATLRWQAPADGDYYVWMISSQPGAAQLEWSHPFLIHSLQQAADKSILTWQGETNRAFTIWATPSLDAEHPFTQIGVVPSSKEWIRHFTNSTDNNALFYQISTTKE
jgi:hypothetical protein